MSGELPTEGSRTNRNITRGRKGRGNGIYVRVAIRPDFDCLIQEISELVDIESYIPGYGNEHADQMVIKQLECPELIDKSLSVELSITVIGSSIDS